MSRRSGSALRATVVGLVAALSLLVGCSSDASTEATTPSTSTTPTSTVPDSLSEPGSGGAVVAPEGFEAVTIVVTLPNGETREWCVWLADTTALRQRGLMGVTDPGLGGAVGMVFVFAEDTSSGFWMKNTPMPLSIAWYAADGSLVGTDDMDPCPADADTCPSTGPGTGYRYAVEVPQGLLEAFGMVDGSTIALGSSCTEQIAAA